MAMTSSEVLPVQPPGIVRQEFGAALKEARRAAGLSQKELAAKVQINTETINRLESGGNSRTDTIEKIRRVLPHLTMNSDPYSAEQAAQARHIREAQEKKDQLEEMRTRTVRIIELIQSLEQLEKVQAMALQAFAADLAVSLNQSPAMSALQRALVKPIRKRKR
jgi:transcriptional regulator with XRE-family HTH domain